MIIFRADGNNKIGLGHLMRCMSIADALKKDGKESIFVLADEYLKDMVEERGYKTFITYTLFDRMQEEIECLRILINKINPQVFVVDSYFVTEKYLSFIKSLCKIVYIDDMAAFPYPADILINYNIYAKPTTYTKLYENSNLKTPKLILGSKFIPLREEFINISMHSISEKVNHILISTGGADPIHLNLDILEFLVKSSFKNNYVFHFIIGVLNSDRNRILELSLNMDNVVIHENVKDMKALMMNCDIAISAAGSTLYELCACGLPTITYVLADNQIEGAKLFEDRGLVVSLGDIRNVPHIVPHIIDKLSKLENNFNKRKKMSDSMQRYVDGLGAERLVNRIFKYL